MWSEDNVGLAIRDCPNLTCNSKFLFLFDYVFEQKLILSNIYLNQICLSGQTSGYKDTF